MKATHRNKHSGSHYFLFSNEVDSNGHVLGKLLRNDAWAWHSVSPADIEPIPAPAPRRPFDYESWRLLWKAYGSALAIRRKGSGHAIPAPAFSEASVAGVFWKSAFETHEYSTDFGDTWHEMSRE